MKKKLKFNEDNSSYEEVTFQLINITNFTYDGICFILKVVLKNYHNNVALQGIKISDAEHNFRQIVDNVSIDRNKKFDSEDEYYWDLDTEEPEHEPEPEPKPKPEPGGILFYHTRKYCSPVFKPTP